MQTGDIRIEATDRWKSAYPGASIGLLAMRGVTNPKQHPELDTKKNAVEAELRARFADHDREALKAIPTIRAYNDYAKRFGKTYHVQLQLESIVHKGKSIPRVAALVEAMFMAEPKSQLLTAGHDLGRLDERSVYRLRAGGNRRGCCARSPARHPEERIDGLPQC